MANGNVTATTAAKFINDVWSPELNKAIKLKLVIAGLFTDFTGRMTADGGGQVFHLPASHNLTANTKSASTDATAETITETEQTFTPSTHQITAQEIEDFAKVMSRYDLRADYTQKSVYALQRAQDVAAGVLFANNTTQTVGVLGAEISDDNIISMWTFIENVSGDGGIQAVVSPACYGGLLKIDKFISALYQGQNPNAVQSAEIGRAYNCKFYVSPLTTGTAPNSSGNAWIGEHFFKCIKKPPTQDAWFSPLAKAWVVATDQIYGMFEKQEADEAAAVTTTARLYGVRLQTLK